MFLSKLSIRQPIFVSMVLLAVTLLGALSYFRMGVDLYPDLSNPVVSVNVSFPGASPEDVETLVTKPIEKAVSTVSGVDNVSATSREGMSFVMVIFNVGHNIQQGAQEVRERLETVKRSLPEGATEPILRRFDPNTMPFFTVAFSVQGAALSPVEMRRMVEEIIVPRLERISGVAAAQVGGLRVQEMGVELNASKLKAFGVSPQQVVTALRAENTVMPSGRVSSATENLPLRTAAEFRDPEEIRRVVVTQRSGRAVTVGEVATVNPRMPEVNSLVRVNGQDTLVIELQKLSGSNIVQTASMVREELKSINRDFPQVVFNIVRDDSTFIEESDRDVTLTLIIGALLAGAIVLLFFRNLRNTLITVAGLPVIVIGTFAVISLLGFTRNIISLMALSLSIGLLIDDAIVVRENIFRHMEAGASPRQAAEKATGEIAFAVLAITLTVIAVFIPVAFTTGMVGRIFKEFGITVAVAVAISLFEAFTLAPLLSAYLAKPLAAIQGKASESKPGLGTRLEMFWLSLAGGYKGVLAWSLRYRWVVAGSALLLFLLSLGLIQFLPFSFFPTTDPSALTVGIQLPPGSTLESTDPIAREVERVAMAQPEVERVYARVGRGSGSVLVTLKKGTPTEPVIQRLRGSSLSQYGRTLTFTQPRQLLGVGGGMGPGGASVRGRPVQIAVRGPTSLETLDQAADRVVERLRTVPGLRDVDKSLPPREPELHVLIDRQRTAQYGVSASSVGQTIRTLVAGTTATEVNWQDQRTEVIVQLRQEDRANAEALMDIPVAGPGGETRPLYTVATIERRSGPTVLEREARQGQVIVGANLEGRSQGAVVPDIQRAMAGISLPPGVTWRFGGQQAQAESAFGSMIFALVLGLIFVYMVLASQFGSLIHPLTVMVALPLSAIGAMLALVIVRADLTVIAMIGIILLMGLATKNSILLVDFIIRYRKEGRSRTESVLAAGPVRLRPILMTTLAIILGMLPTALGIGAAGEFRAPMAIAAVGGIFVSTLLSLVVVPVVYTILDDAVAVVARLFRRRAAIAIPTETVASPGLGGGRGDDLETALNGGGRRRGLRRWWFSGR